MKKLNFEKVFAVYHVINCTYKNGRLQVSSKLDISKFPRYNRYGSLAGNRKDYYTESEIISCATNRNIDDVAYNVCGALVYGAITDPNSTEANRHAEMYYNEIRAMTTDVERIAKNTGYPIEIIQQIKNYLFMEAHNLEGGVKKFSPCLEIAQSWQRLMSKDKKDIKPHDLILIAHEVYESNLVKSGMSKDMVDILNIKWDGKYAVADLTEDGAKEVAYTVKVDCEAEKVIENSNGEMNSYISQARKALCENYRAGKRPKKLRILWY